MRLTLALLVCATACRAREEARDDRDVAPTTRASALTPAPPAPSDAIVPVRASEASQPRWRYLAHGARPRGRERWRFDLTPRDAYGEPATDGRTLYVTAVRHEPEGPADGELFAFDLADGTIRWHVPVGGLHGEPIELFGDVVLVDTGAHCLRRGPESPGIPLRPCVESAPGGLVGLDASTGHERFRASATTDTLRARWTAVETLSTAWVHDGPVALRALALPAGVARQRLVTGGPVLNVTTLGADLLYTAVGRLGVTRVVRRTPSQPRARWEHALPLRTHCPATVAGSVVVLPAFQSPRVTGAVRGVLAIDGADHWTGAAAPQTVSTCGAVEGGVHYQVIDGALVGVATSDGRARAHLPLPGELTSDVMALVDGVFYLSVRGRLVGVDVSDGRSVVAVETGAASAEGVALWGGRGAVVTREPGLVLGFD